MKIGPASRAEEERSETGAGRAELWVINEANQEGCWEKAAAFPSA